MPSHALLRAVLGVLALAALAFVLMPSSHAGKAPAVRFDCTALASAVASFTDFRDAGANVDRVVAMIKKASPTAIPAKMEVIEREVRRLWADGLPREAAEAQLYKRCSEQLGDMGRTI